MEGNITRKITALMIAAVLALVIAMVAEPVFAADDAGQKYTIGFEFDPEETMGSSWDEKNSLFRTPTCAELPGYLKVLLSDEDGEMDEDSYEVEWKYDPDAISVGLTDYFDDKTYMITGCGKVLTTTATVLAYVDGVCVQEREIYVQTYVYYDIYTMGSGYVLPGEQVEYQVKLYDFENDESLDPPSVKWEVSGLEGVTLEQKDDGTAVVTVPQEKGTFTLQFTVYDENGDVMASDEQYIDVKDKGSVDLKVQKSGRNVKLNSLLCGNMYMLSFEGADFEWMTGKDLPFYDFTVEGPSETVTFDQDQESGSYKDFSNNGAIGGGGHPYGVVTFKNPGKYTVTARAYHNGELYGEVTKTITVAVKGTTVSKLTPAKKALTVKWKKQAAETNGYQIVLATNSKFTKGKKTVTISKTGTTSKKVTKLKAKTKYYVRIRTYKTVNGKKVYSAWSKAKSAKTK